MRNIEIRTTIKHNNKMERYALQLKISLNGVKPLIWRRVVVNADIGLEDLHMVIQTVMPWENGHMHKFYNKHQTYMMPYDDCEFEEDGEDMEAYEDALLGDIFTEKGQKLKYEYDFGDSWEHNIVVEKILPPIDDERDALFIKGKNAVPPEDCGGIWGYEHLREVMSDPKHPEYEEMAEWIGLEDGEIFDSTDMGFTDEEFNEMLLGVSAITEEDVELFMHMLENDMLPKEVQEELLRKLEELQKQELLN